MSESCCKSSKRVASAVGERSMAIAFIHTECMQWIAERRVACVLEVGPGSSLAKLWNESHPNVPARSIDEFRSAEAVIRWVQASLV
jgi:[acyl-carrier-protein] S-malonyltransferase